MTCKELVDFLGSYVAGELPEGQRFTFDAHLAVCPDCVNYLESYRETIRLGSEALAAGETEIPDEVPDDLVRAILEARSK